MGKKRKLGVAAAIGLVAVVVWRAPAPAPARPPPRLQAEARPAELASPFGPQPERVGAPSPRPAAAPRLATAPAKVRDDWCPPGADQTLEAEVPTDPRNAAALTAAAERLAQTHTDAVHAAALLASGQTDRLAAWAAGTRDPTSYAIAWQACLQADDSAASCRLLSPAQWARLDPGNAMAWLALADEAGAAGLPQQETDAMQMAASAPRATAYASAVPALLGAAFEGSPAQPHRLLLLAAGWRISGLWRSVGLQQALRYCEPESPAWVERREVCERLADTLLAHAEQLDEHAAGLALGRRVGWTSERLAALDEEQQALEELAARQNVMSAVDCANAHRLQAWMAAAASGGEVAGLRALLRDSGRSVRDWSALRRRDMVLAQQVVETAMPPSD